MLLLAEKSKKRRGSAHISLLGETDNRVISLAIDENRSFSSTAAQVLADAMGE